MKKINLILLDRSCEIMVLCAVMLLSGISGCSRGTDSEEQKKKTPAAAAKSEIQTPVESSKSPAKPIVESVPPVQVPVKPTKPRPPAPPKPKIRITALMKRGDAPPRVGIVQDSTGSWRILREGDTFLGYRVDKINYDAGTVMLDWYGETVRLSLEGLDVKTTVIKPESPKEKPAEAKIVFSDDKFTPTPDELARNIDPNDSKTWPEGYRGPAIERIAAKMGEEPGRPMLSSAPPPTKKFTPTADEVARGIDPNNPKTWPKGYRGPVIERMARSMPPPKSGTEVKMPEIPKPDGTPEEIRQRFFEKYAPKAKADGAIMPDDAENGAQGANNMLNH